jgi:hypothetical protein
VISSHLTKFNLFLLCSNDLDLFIEHFSLSLLVLFFSWFDLLSFAKRVRTYTQPVWYRCKGGRKRERERTDSNRAMRGEPLEAQVERCSNRYDIARLFLFLFLWFIRSFISRYGLQLLTLMARVKWRSTSRDAMILLHRGPIAILSIQSEICCTFSGPAE